VPRLCRTLAASFALSLAPAAAFAQTPAPAAAGTTPRYQLTVDSARHEVVITVGPYDVPSDSGVEDPMATMPMDDILSPIMTWPLRTAIRGYHLTVEDRTGRPLPRRLLHHYGVVDVDRRELLYSAVQNLIGGGAESDDVVLPRTVGVPLEAGHRLAVYFMWKNRSGHDLHGVFLRLRILWIAGNQRPPPRLVMPFWVDVNYHPGGTDVYDVPPGGCVRAYGFTLPSSGHLLALGGHLHAYGSSLRLEDAETGATIARVVARRDPDGTVRGMSRSIFGAFGEGPRLLAGHRYRVVATYDNPTPDTLRGMMGVVGGLFLPDDPGTWPALDPGAPTYIRGRDLRVWEAGMDAVGTATRR